MSFTGLEHEVWKVNGSGRTVAQRWDACWKALNEMPYAAVFGDKTSQNCKARLGLLVDGQSKSDGQAQRDSGAGTAESDSEDEEEKQNKANLVSPSVRAWHSLDLR